MRDERGEYMEAKKTESAKQNEARRISIEQAKASLPGPMGELSAEVFAHGSLVVKMYSPRGIDHQTPHARDEVYLVASGSGEFVSGETRERFAANDFLFAPAGVEHRFENFTDDFF